MFPIFQSGLMNNSAEESGGANHEGEHGDEHQQHMQQQHSLEIQQQINDGTVRVNSVNAHMPTTFVLHCLSFFRWKTRLILFC